MAGSPSTSLETIRRLLFGLLVLGMAGTATELGFMNHYEDWKQLIPFAGMGLSLLALLWFAFSRSTGATRSFRVLQSRGRALPHGKDSNAPAI